MIRVEIPDYLRQIKVSDNQIPIYYTWDGNTIRSKKRPLPEKYIQEDFREKIKEDTKGIVLPQYLKKDFSIGIFKGDRLQGILDRVEKDKTESIRWIIRDEELPKTVRNKNRKYCLMKDSERILANPKVVNTPRILTIRGQDLYNNKVKEHLRGFVIQSIKQSFVPYVKDIEIIKDYPVRVRCYLFDTFDNVLDKNKGRWDVGNRILPYSKAFLDLLATGSDGQTKYFEPKLIDDERLYVTEDPQGGVFCPIPEGHQSKLVFVIAKDDETFSENIKEIEQERLNLLKNHPKYGFIEITNSIQS